MTGKPPETQDEENGINRGSARQPDPDADSAKSSPESEPVGGGKSDHPVADRGEHERYSRVVQATQRACRDRLDAIGDKESRTDRQKRRGELDGVARARRGFAEEESREGDDCAGPWRGRGSDERLYAYGR